MGMREQLRGAVRVYRFTLIQYFKNRANVISLAIMLILAIAMVPLASLMMGGSSTALPEFQPEEENPRIPFSRGGEEMITVYLKDETGLALEELLLPYLQKLRVMSQEDAVEENVAAPHDHALGVHVFFSPTEGMYRIETVTAENSQVHREDIEDLVWLLTNGIEAAKAASLTEGEAAWLDALSSAYAEEGKISELSEGTDVGMETGFAVEYVYAIVLLMLCMTSSSYIIRAVVEEKSSKLIELLMVSIHPLALLCGKILAMMTVVFGTLLAVVSGTAISHAVTGMFLDTSVIGAGLGEMGISLSSLNLGWDAGCIVVISLVLSYLTYSIMSGIAGASCPSMNEIDSAMLSVTFTVLAGYTVSCVVAALPDRTMAVITSLIPFVSSFCAPVHYICGRIGLPVLLLSWVIQLGVILLLAQLGAKVYRDLIMYQGKRMRWKDIWRLARKERGGA